jgi:lysophospholipase L1-like esterase
MKHKYRSALEKLGLIVLSVIITLAVLEIGLRIIGYDALKRLKNGREFILRPSSNSDLKYELTPGAKGYAWGADVEINAHGHRGRMGTPGKFSGFRTIVIGDSITFGNMLSLESTYAYQLHEILNENGFEYEVLNFGVGGYDILQEVALLEHRGLTYEPDLVVVGFCLNDVGIASPNLEYIERVQKYQSRVIFRSRIVQFVADRIDRIRMGTWMKEKNKPEVFQRNYRIRIARIDDNEHVLHELMRSSPDDYPSGWYKNEQRIGRLRYAFEHLSQLAGKENFTVVAVIIPWLVGNPGSYSHETAHQIVTMEARRVGFDVLEIVHEFMDVGIDSIRVLENDPGHPNDIGHRIIAEKLAGYIRDRRPRNTD